MTCLARPWTETMNRPALFAAALWAGLLGLIVERPANAADSLPQVEMIDQRMDEYWKEWEMRPSPLADDGVWARRVFLDLIGRIPRLDELQAFLKSREPDKRAALVKELLYADRYTEELARNWATIWCNLLVGRSGGTDNNDFTNREGLLKYLRDSFAANKAYDQMALELVTASGATRPGEVNFNGAVNYLVNKVNDENATQATSSVSRIFLGSQVQCTQCHNHPFNDWKQQKFWEFNAFFRQVRALRRFENGARDVAYAELVDQDFPGEAGDPSQAVVFYELRNGVTRTAYPVFVDGTEISPSGYVNETNRRQELGKLIVGSPDLARTIVNRMWAHFLGYGFTKPVDDLGPHNPPSHPVLFDELSDAFRERSYDLRQLMTWIVLSRPYQLSSTPTAENQSDDPASGETPRFTHFYPRQLRAEELYQSLLLAGQAGAEGSYEEQERQRREWLRQFVIAFGTDEGDETTTFNGSIPQALMMFNGELVQSATKTDNGTLLAQLAASSLKPTDKVSQLFLAAVARRPTKEEVDLAAQLFRVRGDEAGMLQDLWWALLNSNEFILNH
jgi:hypothetical protein